MFFASVVGFRLILRAVDLLVPGVDPDSDDLARALAFGVWAALLGTAAWLTLRSDLPTLVKAMVTFALYGVFYSVLAGNLGMGLIPALAIGGLFFVGVLAYLRRSGRPWPFTYALVLVSLVMLAITIGTR